MVTEFNSAHKHSESPPNVRRSEARDHSRLPKVAGVMTSGIQAIVSREPKKWTKLYSYKFVETLGYAFREVRGILAWR